MKIKSLLISGSFFVLSLTTYAQKSELRSAKSNYDKYAGLKGNTVMASIAIPSLSAAKEAIDKATIHEKTKDDASGWTYKALIYADLALLDSVETKTAPLVADANAALKKAVELDVKGDNKDNINVAGWLLAQYYLNKGVREFQGSNFASAYQSFNNGLVYLPADTTFTYYAGLSAVNAQQYPQAIEKYNALTKTNFSALNIVYLDLSKLYALSKDTASAIRIAGEGAKKFPNDTQLATQEIELSLVSGKQKETIEKIEAQLQKEPNNKSLAFYLGIAYSAIKNYTKAEDAYKKALAIDLNYLDANINLGGMIMNNGIELYNKANKLPTNKQKEYDAMMKQAQAEFDKAYPYIQKAISLDPKSIMALENLRTYYIVKRNNAKADEVKKQIDALK